MPIERAGAPASAQGLTCGGTEFVGIRFARSSLADVVQDVLGRGKEDPFAFLVTPNVDHVVRLASSPERSALDAAYQAAHARLCDSRVLALLARAFGIRLSVVTGSDLTASLLDRAAGTGRRVAVVGASGAAVERLRQRYAGLDFVHHAPPMGLLSNRIAMAEAAQFVARAQADFQLFVVGSPQQELLAHKILTRGDAVGTGLCVGASIDFLTGRARRAPRLVQRVGLEWAFRLLSQPRRLWRRYLVDGPRILGIAWRWHSARGDSRL